MHVTYLSNAGRTAQQLRPIHEPHSIAELSLGIQNGVLVTYTGGETGYPALPFDATPCDRVSGNASSASRSSVAP